MQIGNRVTEHDIRNWLDESGMIGRTAVITELELHAIKRPGWVQVFRFCVRVKQRPEDDDEDSTPPWVDRVGVVLDDERKKSQNSKTKIWLFESEEEQIEKLAEVSEGLITCRKNLSTQPGQLLWLVGFFVFVLLGIAVASSFQ
ncbi:MAG: hypothetical protein AB8B55_11190 [Mariniblastus sp.]